jgi:hypothetical protein
MGASGEPIGRFPGQPRPPRPQGGSQTCVRRCGPRRVAVQVGGPSPPRTPSLRLTRCRRMHSFTPPRWRAGHRKASVSSSASPPQAPRMLVLTTAADPLRPDPVTDQLPPLLGRVRQPVQRYHVLLRGPLIPARVPPFLHSRPNCRWRWPPTVPCSLIGRPNPPSDC